MHDGIIKTCLKAAATSTHKRCLVAAVIFDKSRVVSIGVNEKRYNRKLHRMFWKWEGSIHAEQSAILNARRDVKGLNMLVIRLNNHGELRYAKPCPFCISYINYVGLKNVFYSDGTGQILQLINRR